MLSWAGFVFIALLLAGCLNVLNRYRGSVAEDAALPDTAIRYLSNHFALEQRGFDEIVGRVERVARRGPIDVVWSCDADAADSDTADLDLTVSMGAHGAFDASVGPPGVMDDGVLPAAIVPHLGLVVVRRSTRQDAIGNRLKLQRPIRTGDVDFDRDFTIESSAPDALLDALFASAELRDHVRTLLDAGFDTVVFYSLDAQIKATVEEPKMDLLYALVPHSDTFAALAGHLPHLELIDPSRHVVGQGITGARDAEWQFTLAVVLGGGALAFAFFSFFFDDLAYQPPTAPLISSWLQVALALYVVLMAALAWVHAKTSTGFRVLLRWNLVLCAVLALAGSRAVVLANMWLDDSSSHTVVLDVREVYETQSRGAHCSATVEPTAELLGLDEVRIPCTDHDALREVDSSRRKVKALYRDGFFCHPWVVDAQADFGSGAKP